MSKVIVNKSNLSGNIVIPPSKSLTHRALICAALAKSKSVISNVSLSDDTRATISCLEKLGCTFIFEDNRAYINSTNLLQNNEEMIELFCNESATTLRLLIPICAALGLKVKFTGKDSLINRPLSVYKEILPLHGVKISYDDRLPFIIEDYDEEGPHTLKNGVFEIRGDISSQFISGLLFSFPLIKGESKIVLTKPLESKGYVDLTINTLNNFNIKINETDDGFSVKGNQKFLSNHMYIESDDTFSALYHCANKLGSEINITSDHNDKLSAIIDSFSMDKNNDIDCRNIPDLIPTLCVLAAFSNGRTRFFNAARLKHKESDRIISCTEMITSLGGEAKSNNDSIIIDGKGKLSGGVVNSYNDHRIIMASTIAGLFSQGSTTITNCENVSKSYESFFDDIKSLGGDIFVDME